MNSGTVLAIFAIPQNINMKNFYITLIVLVFAFAKANSQVVINELDADTPSTNDRQFVELLTDQPFQSLDGYVLVFYNGRDSNNASYFAADLDGLVSDNNGLVVVGSSRVNPAVDRIVLEAQIQIGADAVAIYTGDASDFPEDTPPTMVNLIDALAYDTDDADDVELLQALGLTIQYNEDENNKKTEESIQRMADGSYEVKAPTPFSLNDATEPSFIGVDFSITATEFLNEGDFFSIEFTLSRAASQDFNLSFSLNNQGFNTDDYTGTTEIFIPAGLTSQTLDFNLIDDTIDEGDEFFKINLGNNLPAGFKRLRDNVEYLVIDNDFTVANYGNPDNPTFGIVASTAPSDYYDRIDNMSGEDLKNAITSIIAETGVVRHHTYADITTILKDADASALNSNKVWLLYNEIERRDVLFQDGSNGTGEWNREHVFPRSRGGYNSLEDVDDIADGINFWVETSVDSLRHGNSDAHHLRATDAPTNSSRGNQNYNENTNLGYNGPAGSQGSWHGDVARSIFYMTLRYNFTPSQMLEVVNGNPDDNTDMGQIGDLETLLRWHNEDPADDFEMNRNNVIYEWQRNRNPFIDQPDLVDFVFGDKAGQPFTLSEQRDELDALIIYPNPSNGYFFIQNITEPVQVQVIDALGRIAYAKKITTDTRIDHQLSTGIYLLKLSSNSSSTVRKIIVE